MKNYFIFLLCLGIFLISITAAQASTPREKLETYIDKVSTLFEEYEPEKNSKQELKNQLSQIAHQIFNFEIMSRMSLAHYWRSFSQEQQKEFVSSFTNLLEETYFEKIINHIKTIQDFNREDIVFLEEIELSSRKTEIKTFIRYQDKEIPVKYRFVRLQEWRIYDVYVEGVSLIQNYRSQFTDYLLDHTPEELLDYLKAKRSKIDTPQEQKES